MASRHFTSCPTSSATHFFHAYGYQFIDKWHWSIGERLRCGTGHLVCSPCHFFHLGTAHVFLLGLLVDFWAQWLPSTKAKPRPDGPTKYYVLPKAVRKDIAYKTRNIMLTELFTKPYRDITKCDSSASCTLGRFDCIFVGTCCGVCTCMHMQLLGFTSHQFNAFRCQISISSMRRSRVHANCWSCYC